MLAEIAIVPALESMLGSIAVPPAPTREIFDRASAAPHAAVRASPRYSRYALAAAISIALIFAIFPKASLALFERIVVDSYAAAHKFMDWTPPPPPPKSLDRSLVFEKVSVASAQSKVPFTIVPPAGTPPDATLTAIETMPVLAYDKTTKSWSKDWPALSFEYRRSGGREFDLRVEEDDPRTGAPPTYMYQADDLPGGKVALTKYANFAWINGNQMMSVTEGNGITAAEIAAIRTAMHGRPVAHTAPETIVRRYSLP